MAMTMLFVLSALAPMDGEREPEQTPQDLFWQKLSTAGDRTLSGTTDGEAITVALQIKNARELHLVQGDRVVWELSRTGSGFRLLWRDGRGDVSLFDTFDIGQPSRQELDAADETIAADPRKKRWRWIWRWEQQTLHLSFLADGYQAISETHLKF